MSGQNVPAIQRAILCFPLYSAFPSVLLVIVILQRSQVSFSEWWLLVCPYYSPSVPQDWYVYLNKVENIVTLSNQTPTHDPSLIHIHIRFLIQ